MGEGACPHAAQAGQQTRVHQLPRNLTDSLLDVMSKMYEKVLDHRMQALQAGVAPDKGVQPEQLGFSPNHRVEDSVHGLVEGVKHNRNDGNRVVILHTVGGCEEGLPEHAAREDAGGSG